MNLIVLFINLSLEGKLMFPTTPLYIQDPNNVGVFVAKTGGKVRVGVTGATACAHRGLLLEEAMGGELDASGIDSVELPVEQMNSDIHASAEYRAHLVKVMTKRAVEACR